MSHPSLSTSQLHRSSRLSGFTLVELLVVFSVISLLIALLLPALAGARDQSKRLQCLSNLKGWGFATLAYCTDNKDYMPRGRPFSGAGIGNFLSGLDQQTIYGRYLMNEEAAIVGEGTTSSRMRFFLSTAAQCPNRPSPQVGPPNVTNFFRNPYAMYGGSAEDFWIRIDNVFNAGRRARSDGTRMPDGVPALWADRIQLYNLSNNGGQSETNHDPAGNTGAVDPTYRPKGGNVANLDGSAKWFNYSPTSGAGEASVYLSSGAATAETKFPSNAIFIVTQGTNLVDVTGPRNPWLVGVGSRAGRITILQ
jgi:hypothetical protein